MTNKNWDALPVKTVLKNVENIFKSRDISKMTKATYKTLYLMSGFIAHYDINGFKHHYSSVSDLARDILRSSDATDPDRYTRDKWFAESYGLLYCQSKAAMYSGLEMLATKYFAELSKADGEDKRNEDIAYAKFLLEKHGLTIN